MYDPIYWHRKGRGKSLSFFATTCEICEWLLHWLPRESEPYTLNWVQREVRGTSFAVTDICEKSLVAMIEELSTYPRIPTNLWIRSLKLTPADDFKSGDLDANCSLSGLVRIQASGTDTQGRRTAFIMAIVDTIQHNQTAEIHQHLSYLSIYRRLVNRIRPELKYSATRPSENGQLLETPNMMTEGCVREIKAGIQYVAQPGNVK